MKKASFLFLFLSAFCVCAQHTGLAPETQKTVDSLGLELKNARHDTTRAYVYLALCEALYFNYPDTVIPLAKKAEAIAQKRIAAGGLNKKEEKAFQQALASV